MPFSVEDFVPERLDLELTAATPAIAAGETVPVAVSGRFLFGAPAADLAVTAEVVVGVDPQPFPDWADYRFGLATEEWTGIRAEPAAGPTGTAGNGQIEAGPQGIGSPTQTRMTMGRPPTPKLRGGGAPTPAGVSRR